MLNDYIQEYILAMQDGNEKVMKQIERELAQVGMDAYTLRTLVSELTTEKRDR